MLRKDSPLDRLRTAFVGPRQERSLAATNQAIYSGYGVPSTFRAETALDSYGDNVWLYGAVSKIANEIARTKFKLRTKGDRPEEVVSHQALETLALPQPIRGEKSMLLPKYLPAKAEVRQRAELLETKAFQTAGTFAFAGSYLGVGRA